LNNANLIIANERGVQFNSIARNDIRLKYALGSQVILINALIKVIIDEKLVDLKKVETSTNNFDKLRSLIDKFNREEASKITGVTQEAIRNAALLLTKPGNCYIICGKDIEENLLAEDAIRALMNLCALLNPVYRGDAGSGKVSLFFSRSHNNSQGVNDVGVVPGFFPGYANTNDVSNKEKIEKSWGVKFPDAILKKDAENVIDLALNSKLKALYIVGENLVVNYPNGKKIKEACKKIDFIVVQDTFLTETAQLADVVLPAATFAEKEGTFTNMGMTVQRLNKAIKPVGDVKPDWQIICSLAQKMEHSCSYVSPKEILTEIESISPVYAGINYDRLKRKEFHWASSVYNKNKSTKYTFSMVKPKSSEIRKNKDFPFVLLTGASLNHQGTFSRHSKSLMSVAPECFVEINKKDAQVLQINNGDRVTIESAQNKLTLKAKVTSKLSERVVFVSEDYEWMPVNLLRDRVHTSVKIYKETV